MMYFWNSWYCIPVSISGLSRLCFILLAPYCTPLLCLTLPLLALLYSALLWLALLSSNCFVIHSVQSCLILPSMSCLFYLARLLLCFVLLLDSSFLHVATFCSTHVCSAAQCSLPDALVINSFDANQFADITFSYHTCVAYWYKLKASRFSNQS